MSLIQWKPEFSVGVPAIDYEHKELIELINGLHAKLGGAESAYTVPEFLGEICTKIGAHFALEEQVMREQKYDEYLDHKAAHEDLLDEIRDMMDDYELHGRLDDARLAERLNGWFTEHFRTKDARLHKHLG